MANYFTKADTAKAAPTKKGDIKFQHNLLDMVGETLIKGRLDPKILERFQADINFKIADKWSLNLGYNQDWAGTRQALKGTISRKF